MTWLGIWFCLSVSLGVKLGSFLADDPCDDLPDGNGPHVSVRCP